MRRAIVVTAGLVIGLAACGGGSRELAGFQRTPPPEVGAFELPDLADDGTPFALRADPGELLVVYFGYTNCPDFCPTTLSDVRLARGRLDDPERIAVAMITIDPDRDLPVLADYVGAFFEDGHALGTDDPDLLAAVAAPFGTTYVIEPGDDGNVDVGHRTDLYAVDDQGQIVVTWQFGVEIDELAADLEVLLDESQR